MNGLGARIWGSRGSVAVSGRGYERHGGNTSCVQVLTGDGGPAIILDAGTGLRPLGQALAAQDAREIHLFLSHLHLDHLQGLAFFTPLYVREVELHIWGPASPTRPLRDRVGAYMSEPLFPVNVADVPCTAVFHDAPEDGVTIDGVDVWASPVAHQGSTVGYRIEHAGRSLVYISDHEPALACDLRTMDTSWISGYSLAARADVLLHDSQYFEHEYPSRMGWGHSSVDHAVAFTQVCGVGQLVLFHHDPAHDDDTLRAKLARALELWGDEPTPPVLAYDGMELAVDAAVSAATR